MQPFPRLILIALFILALQACGWDSSPNSPNSVSNNLTPCELNDSELPFASEVVSFNPGPNAGYGQDEFPEIVLGPPKPAAQPSGSVHVLSLGIGGEIILSFGDRTIVNGEGPDFVVFENPFAIGGDESNPFAEFAQVSVSTDGENWSSFQCATNTEYPWDGCAGWGLIYDFNGCTHEISPHLTGGDLFDLEDLGLNEARYIRITDLSESGGEPSAGFDLDAVGGFHIRND